MHASESDTMQPKLLLVFFPLHRSTRLDATSGNNQRDRGPDAEVEVQAEVRWRWNLNDNFPPCPMGVQWEAYQTRLQAQDQN